MMDPESTGSSPMIVLTKTDLPFPGFPQITEKSFIEAVKERLSKTTLLPYDFVSPETLSAKSAIFNSLLFSNSS